MSGDRIFRVADSRESTNLAILVDYERTSRIFGRLKMKQANLILKIRPNFCETGENPGRKFPRSKNERESNLWISIPIRLLTFCYDHQTT